MTDWERIQAENARIPLRVSVLAERAIEKVVPKVKNNTKRFYGDSIIYGRNYLFWDDSDYEKIQMRRG
jgi:hypothetical protein